MDPSQPPATMLWNSTLDLWYCAKCTMQGVSEGPCPRCGIHLQTPAKTAFKLENHGVTTCSQCGHGPLSRETATCAKCRATLLDDPNPKQTNFWLVPSIVAAAACVIGLVVFIPIAFRSSKQNSMQELKAIEKVAQDRKDKIAAAKLRIELAKQQREDEKQQAIDTLVRQNEQIISNQQMIVSQHQQMIVSQQQQQSEASQSSSRNANQRINEIGSQVKRMQDNQPQRWRCINCNKIEESGTVGGMPNSPSVKYQCGDSVNPFLQRHEWTKQ